VGMAVYGMTHTLHVPILLKSWILNGKAKIIGGLLTLNEKCK
jgi:hypothetical protein